MYFIIKSCKFCQKINQNILNTKIQLLYFSRHFRKLSKYKKGTTILRDCQLCNTKELFDKTFFCLNKGKEEKSLGAVICKERSCLVRRHFDGKLEQGCGKCPKNKTNLSNIQCAQCHKNSFCNTDTFFESQIFCWEKNALNWIKNKGTRVCKVGVCFIGVDKNKMGLVQGCDKCKRQHNLAKCSDCSSTSLCNTETILPPPIKCFHFNSKFQQNLKINKTCHHVYDSCYIARDVFWRVEQNCGECPSKYQKCVKCNNNFCNKESLLPLTTTTIKQKTKITTTSTTTTTSIIPSTKIFITSEGQINKVKMNVIFIFAFLIIIL
uniref:Uncharacterized protein n=1 Tax=Meloidogyne enterolobii TaxID=390850 RepID=A0A6V7V979_MELEN|nr:unnamed protein product [Meloidogyne enterolobii]